MPGTTFSETFTSSANTTDQTDTVMTVDAGKGFEVAEVKVAIESGAGSDVSVQVFSGDKPVAPQDDAVDIAGQIIELPADVTLSPGDELVARHDNAAASAFDVTVIIVGDEHD